MSSATLNDTSWTVPDGGALFSFSRAQLTRVSEVAPRPPETVSFVDVGLWAPDLSVSGATSVTVTDLPFLARAVSCSAACGCGMPFRAGPWSTSASADGGLPVRDFTADFFQPVDPQSGMPMGSMTASIAFTRLLDDDGVCALGHMLQPDLANVTVRVPAPAIDGGAPATWRACNAATESLTVASSSQGPRASHRLQSTSFHYELGFQVVVGGATCPP